MRRTLLILVALLVLAPQAYADRLYTIELNNRSAEEMIPVLRPMLSPQSGLSGQGYLLLLRGSEEDYQRVQGILQRLDSAPQQLVIHVRQGGGGDTLRYGGEVGRDGGVRVYGDSSRRDEAIGQRVMALEGQWARIAAGHQVPITNQQITRDRHGTTIQRSTEYRDVTSGFEVRPQVSGDQVRLDIRTSRNRLASRPHGAIETQGIDTSITVRLGEWVTIGGINESSDHSGIGTIYATRGSSASSGTIQLRVELAP